jgi:hypothetical protein
MLRAADLPAPAGQHSNILVSGRCLIAGSSSSPTSAPASGKQPPRHRFQAEFAAGTDDEFVAAEVSHNQQ